MAVLSKAAPQRNRPPTEAPRRVVDAALEVFLANGYGLATVDEVVRLAHVSKTTVYKHFPSKAALFTAVVDAMVGEVVAPVPEVEGLDLDLADTLLRVAEEHERFVLSERHIRLARLVAAEAGRFPELGNSYYHHGPARGHDKLARFLAQQATVGAIELDDPFEAAEDFWGMLLHHGTLRRLYEVATPPTERDARTHARGVVERFLRMYPAKRR
jgi:TetR/AcrR family transcriptional repressor of mexJK operon